MQTFLKALFCCFFFCCRPTLIAQKIPESALVVVHTSDLQVLLLERTDRPGFWQSVTGSKDYLDEPLLQVASREVAEETSIIVGSVEVPHHALVDWQHQVTYEIYPGWRHRYQAGVMHNTEHWFGLTVPTDLSITLAPLEHTAYLWLPYQLAAQRCFSPSNRAAILQLPQRLKSISS